MNRILIFILFVIAISLVSCTSNKKKDNKDRANGFVKIEKVKEVPIDISLIDKQEL